MGEALSNLKLKKILFQAITLKDNKLYVIGGTSGYFFSIDVHCLDILDRNWHYLSPNIRSSIDSPSPR